MNTSNSDNVIVTSNLTLIKVKTERYFNILTTLKKETNTESSISISEKMSSHHNSAEVIDNTDDDNGNNLLNT